MSARICREHLPAGVEVSVVSDNVDLYLSLCLTGRFGARSGDESTTHSRMLPLKKKVLYSFFAKVIEAKTQMTWSFVARANWSGRHRVY